ncbi:MAG: GTP-binding protein [Fimbriimonadaceae bacterium]
MIKVPMAFLCISAAVLGAAALHVPGKIVSTYDALRETHPRLAECYLWGMICVACVTVFVVVMALVKLVKNTRDRGSRDDREVPTTPAGIKTAIGDNLEKAGAIATTGSAEDAEIIKAETTATEIKLETGTLEIVAFGTISSGKSSLLNALAGRDVFSSDVKGGTTTDSQEVSGGDKIVLVDTPGIGEIWGADHEQIARTTAAKADLVLFVVDGALKNFEFNALRNLCAVNKRVLLCLNKADWISENDRKLLVEQLTDQLKVMIRPEDILVVQSSEAVRNITRVLPNGAEIDEQKSQPPDISALSEHIQKVSQNEGKDLLLANLLLRSSMLVVSARERVRAHMDKRAKEVVESHMWQAGGMAALAPGFGADLFVTSVVVIDMTFKLSKVYGEPMTMEAARKLASELGMNLATVLGTSAVLPALGAAVATGIKAVPGVGTIVGGALQGVIQALVTRWIGLVLMEHFRDSTQLRSGSLMDLARKKWSELTTPAALANLAKQAIKHLKNSDSQVS